MSTTEVPITAQEAAERLRCHERTIRRMIGRGELRARLVAGRYLIDPADLHRVNALAIPEGPAPRPRRRNNDEVAERYSRLADDITAASRRGAR